MAAKKPNPNKGSTYNMTTDVVKPKATTPTAAQVKAWVTAGTAAQAPPPAPAGGAGQHKGILSPPPPDTRWDDSIYEGQKNNLLTNLGNLKTGLIGQGTQLGQDYGVDYTGDPINGASGFSIADNVDVSNPFSRAALLKKAYTQQSTGDGNRLAASGQLYSGAYQNAQNADTSNFTQGQDSLKKDFQSQFGGLLGQYLTAQGQEGSDELTAQGAAISRHANDPALSTRRTPTQRAALQFGVPQGQVKLTGPGKVPAPAGAPKVIGTSKQAVTGSAVKPKKVKKITVKGALGG